VLHLDLAIPPEWGRIDQVREAVSHCITAVYADRDLRDALAMVASELLENAFKYGKQAEVKITVRETAGRVVVTVTNEVDEGTPHPEALEQRVAWVKQFGDPRRAYQAAIERAYTDEADASGLGLARISYEGGCNLDCDTATAGRVTVRAECSVSRPS
jgi:hypothetical protein